MKQEEFAHIDNLIFEIQKELNWDPKAELTQREFEFLIESVYLITNTRISLSTIKRIWDHENKYLPRVTTLDILCQYLGYSNWSQFKFKSLNKEQKGRHPLEFKQKAKKFRKIAWMSIGGIIIILLIIFFESSLVSGGSEKFDELKFEIDKIIGNEVPVTVVFSYDLAKVEFDSAFIQLSWNSLERNRIEKDENLLTSTYYIPGIHEAKLIINDSIVQTKPVYIKHDGWLTIFRNTPDDVVPIYINSDEVYSNGYIMATTDLLADFRADTSQESYYVSYIMSEDFNVDGDDFTFNTRIKNPASKGKFNCQSSSIYIYTERGGLFLTFNKSGCVGNTSIIIGDKVISGKKNDLSALGRDFSAWQDIKGIVADKKLDLYINDTLVYQCDYKQDLGKILTWQYFFMGCGAVDYIGLADSAGKLVYEDDFE